MKAECYVIAGPNGGGKTTFALEFLPRFAQCLNFINPDLIATGLSPLDPRRSMVRAGRLVMQEIRRYISRYEDFAFETTLSGRTYLRQLREMKTRGYAIHIIYLWLPSSDLALWRIHERVERGGHDVPEKDVRRRFGRSLRNLFQLYRPLANTLHFFDNSGEEPALIFQEEEGDASIFQRDIYNLVLQEAVQ